APALRWREPHRERVRRGRREARLREEPRQRGADAVGFAPLGEPLELERRRADDGTRTGAEASDEDLRVPRRRALLARELQLLEQLLARSEAREDDRDVVERLQTGERDHADRQVEDAHR